MIIAQRPAGFTVALEDLPQRDEGHGEVIELTEPAIQLGGAGSPRRAGREVLEMVYRDPFDLLLQIVSDKKTRPKTRRD